MGRDFVVGLALVGLLDTPAAVSNGSEQGDSHPAVRSALRAVVSLRDMGIETVLRLHRRPAPPPDVRARIVALLPSEGALSPNGREGRKIAALQPLLALHGRDLDLDVRLFTVGGAAWAGLHARSVLLVSREALGILDAQEFVALAAHELGHDVVWDAYETARAAGDVLQVQVLELQCDAIAVLALEQLGVTPDALVSATRKLASHNARIGWTPDNTRYVPLGARTTFIRTFAAPRITTQAADMVAGRRP